MKRWGIRGKLLPVSPHPLRFLDNRLMPRHLDTFAQLIYPGLAVAVPAGVGAIRTSSSFPCSTLSSERAWRLDMRAVVQRVQEAWVRVNREEIARIGAGLLILVGVAQEDGPEDVAYLSKKLVHLRIFTGNGRLMHLSLLDLNAEVLLVSQFTLLGDCRKGRRPSFDAAAPPEIAEQLYEDLAKALTNYGLRVATGRFRQMMEVGLINDGPVTLIMDSRKIF